MPLGAEDARREEGGGGDELLDVGGCWKTCRPPNVGRLSKHLPQESISNNSREITIYNGINHTLITVYRTAV